MLPCAALLSGSGAFPNGSGSLPLGSVALPYESGSLFHGSAAALPNGSGSLSHRLDAIVAIFGHKFALEVFIVYLCVRVLCILFLHCTDETQKGKTASFILVVCS